MPTVSSKFLPVTVTRVDLEKVFDEIEIVEPLEIELVAFAKADDGAAIVRMRAKASVLRMDQEYVMSANLLPDIPHSNVGGRGRNVCENRPMRARATILAIVSLLLLTGCGHGVAKAITISPADVEATHININEAPTAHRVVALANGSAEIIDAIGLKSILVGRDIASTEPSLKAVPIVTSGHQVIAEKIIALNPDVVIIDASVGPQQALDALRAASINIVTIDEAWKVDEISIKVREVANAIGAPRSGDQLATYFENVSVATPVRKATRIAFLYLRGGNSIYLLGGQGSGADSVIEAIGGTDVGAQVSKVPFAPLTAEIFAKANPQIILVMTKGLESVGGVSGLLALPGIAQSDAGKNSRVIAVDDSLLLSFGPRTPSMLEKLAAAVDKVAP